MESGLFAQGLELMMFGMGTVIVFLTLLVGATGLMSRLVQRYAPPPAAVAVESQELDPTLVAAITAAVHQHRSRR